jgi:REP element-mobilizing transposase RayT
VNRLKTTDPADWHVFGRGTRRLVLYREDQDYEVFLAYLRQGLMLAGCTLWAYVLMSNHYHLALRGTSQQLRRCMHHVNRLYSLYHNRKYGLGGHCFDGPYQAYRQGTIFFLLRAIAYIFLNPVTAGMVSRPEEYRWSGYASFMGEGASPLPVSSWLLFSSLQGGPAAAREKFLIILELESLRQQRKTEERLTATEVQRQQFLWLLEEARLRKDRLQGEDPGVVALYWAHLCGIRPQVATRVLGGVSPSTWRTRLRRFRERLEADPERKARVAPP